MRPVLVSSKMVFNIFLLTIVVTSLIVFLMGLDIKRSIYENTLITLTILSTCFCSFLTAGLFYGFKMKDTVGKLTDKIKFVGPSGDVSGIDFIPEVGDGIEGLLAGILLWLVATVAIILMFFFFETILWATIMVFGAALYWIFFRATRLVFKKSKICKGDILSSLRTGVTYTVLYSSWIYLLVLGFHFLKR